MSLPVTPRLHPLVNRNDLDQEGFVLSQQTRKTIFDLQQSQPLNRSFKLSKKKSPIFFGPDVPRSLLFTANRVFALYRNLHLPKYEGTLGACLPQDGFVKLSQDLHSGTWFAVKIVLKGTDREIKNLALLKRLEGHIPRNQEGNKEYLIQTLLYGDMASRYCTSIQETTRIYIKILQEWQRFHQTGLNHGDGGPHNFMYDPETDLATVIDFNTASLNPQKQHIDIQDSLGTFCIRLGLDNSSYYGIQRIQELINQPDLFDLAIKMSILLQLSKINSAYIKDLTPIIEIMENALSRSRGLLPPHPEPSICGIPHFFINQKREEKIDFIKALIIKNVNMPLIDYIALVKEKYSVNRPTSTQVIEETKASLLRRGLSEEERASLPLEKKIAHYTDCKKQAEDYLIRAKQDYSLPWNAMPEDQGINLLGIIDALELCEEHLQTLKAEQLAAPNNPSNDEDKKEEEE